MCLFEHYLLLELIAYKELKRLDYPIQYWRTNYGTEVDFILNKGQIAIEAKISSNINNKDLSGLISFAEENKPQKCFLVCLEQQPRLVTIKNIKVKILPIQEFLKQLWNGEIL